MLARIKVAPKHVLRLEEATGNGRYLMIGAAELRGLSTASAAWR